METYFVSGHLDLSRQEFLEHYAPKMRAALDAGAGFVVGDAHGADLFAQDWLLFANCPHERVMVYHMLQSPRNNVGFPTVGGFKTDEARDEAMTLASFDDIAWVRPGRESSGTAKNLKRRERVRLTR